MHPLAADLSGLSDADLHKKHGGLIKRINQAYRIGPASIINQLQMLMENYTSEIQRRNAKTMEEMMNKGKGMSGIIDIN